MSTGGTLKKHLDELEAAGFIQSYIPYGFKRKQQFFRLIDEYSLFYFHWILPLHQKGIEQGEHYWQTKAKTPSAIIWAGYAFEILCLKHVEWIKNALGINGIHAEVGSWKYVPPKNSKEKGVQIDLLFDREDGVITVCEIKFYQKKIKLDKENAKKLAEKLEQFERLYPTKKTISLALISLYGIKPSFWSEDLIDDEIVFEELLSK